MKKHGITDDIPNIPLNEEDKVELGDGVRQGDSSGTGDKSLTINHED